MIRFYTLVFLLAFSFGLFSQPNFTALDSVTPFTGRFHPGINMGYHPNWTNEQLGNISAGNPTLGLPGIGAKSTRPALYEVIFASFGYNLSLYDFQVYAGLGMNDFVGIVGGPPQWNLDFTNYCPGQPSAIYKDLYEPIWDPANGTPYNEDNPYAAYVYKLVETYRDYVTFWEIWNEPGFDFSNQNGRKQPGQPGNWWDNDPNPCDYQLRAPIEHYVRILRISWEIIKTLDPTAYVTLGDPGFPSFLDAVLRNTDEPTSGAVTPAFPLKGGAYFDAVSFHAYPHFDFTAYDPVLGIFERHSDGGADGLVTAQNRFKTVLETHDFDGVTHPKKEWIVTEYNAPRRAITSNQWLSGAEMQRNYILKVLLRAKVENIAQMDVYQLFDSRPETEAVDEFDLMGMYANNTGVVAYNQVANDQGKAMKTFTDLFFETNYDPARTAALNLPAGVRGYAFRQTDGEYVYALWAETQTDRSETASATYSFPASLGLVDLQRFNWDFGYTGLTSSMSPNGIALTGMPIFLKKNNVSNCSISASVTNILCNDNGTPTNPADDKFSFRLTVNGSASGSGGWTSTIAGQTVNGSYGVAKNLTGFSISGGTLMVVVRDTANASCQATTNVVPPPTCSNQGATQYCNSRSDFPWHEWISGVQVGNLNKTSSKTNYSDFTLNSTALATGQSHPATFSVGYSWLTFDEYFRVWIDFDKDKIFETSELVGEGILDAPALGIVVGSLTTPLDIPAGAATGVTRMRVSMKRGGFPDACELIPFGEVEDYNVNVTTGTTSCNISATISNVTCNNNGTPTIGGDDTYTCSATVTGVNASNGWSVNVGGNTIGGVYGTPRTIGPFLIIGGTQNLVFHDLVEPACQTTVIVQPPQPCSNGGGTGTYCPSSGDFPWHDWIAQIDIGDLEHTSSKASYSDFLSRVATVQAGGTYPIQLTTGFSWFAYDEFWRIWVDYDKDGEFESNELIFSELNQAPPFPTTLWTKSGSISIPATATPGVTRMRIVMHRGNLGADACGTYDFGETEDYSINILGTGGQTCQVFAQISNLACQNAGTPSNPSDDSYSFSLTVTGAGVSSGWQAVVGTTTFSGTYGTPRSFAGYPISGGNLNFVVRDNADTSCAQTVSVTPPPTCSNQTGPCSSRSDFPWHDWIIKVQFSNLNNTSGKSSYSDFTAQTVNVNRGASYPLNLTTGFSWQTYDEYWRIWMDFDKDGQFETSEIVFENMFAPPGNGLFSVDYTGQLVIPATAATGSTKMRVSMKRDAFPDPCEVLPFGEVEDYTVVVAQGLEAGDDRKEEDFFEIKNLTLHPNPAGERLRISTEDYLGSELKVQFFNQLGVETKQLFFQKIETAVVEISLREVMNGQYYLRFSSPGKRVVSRKLMVARGY